MYRYDVASHRRRRTVVLSLSRGGTVLCISSKSLSPNEPSQRNAGEQTTSRTRPGAGGGAHGGCQRFRWKGCRIWRVARTADGGPVVRGLCGNAKRGGKIKETSIIRSHHVFSVKSLLVGSVASTIFTSSGEFNRKHFCSARSPHVFFPGEDLLTANPPLVRKLPVSFVRALAK